MKWGNRIKNLLKKLDFLSAETSESIFYNISPIDLNILPIGIKFPRKGYKIAFQDLFGIGKILKIDGAMSIFMRSNYVNLSVKFVYFLNFMVNQLKCHSSRVLSTRLKYLTSLILGG